MTLFQFQHGGPKLADCLLIVRLIENMPMGFVLWIVPECTTVKMNDLNAAILIVVANKNLILSILQCRRNHASPGYRNGIGDRLLAQLKFKTKFDEGFRQWHPVDANK